MHLTNNTVNKFLQVFMWTSKIYLPKLEIV